MALDVLAVVFGIFYTIRKLDAQSRAPSEFPHVPEADFLRWQARERSAYHYGALACVLKLVVGLPFQFLVGPRLPSTFHQLGGALIDLSWLVMVIVTLILGAKTRKERARLGIWLGSRGGPAPSADDSERDS
jgi:hypothetical protein